MGPAPQRRCGNRRTDTAAGSFSGSLVHLDGGGASRASAVEVTEPARVFLLALLSAVATGPFIAVVALLAAAMFASRFLIR